MPPSSLKQLRSLSVRICEDVGNFVPSRSVCAFFRVTSGLMIWAFVFEFGKSIEGRIVLGPC